MEIKKSREAKTRMVHVRLPGGIHKKVRIRAAEADQTIQDWVLQAIQNELKLSESISSVDKADE
jgi:predicted HicB family RNase H-like nuclease